MIFALWPMVHTPVGSSPDQPSPRKRSASEPWTNETVWPTTNVRSTSSSLIASMRMPRSAVSVPLRAIGVGHCDLMIVKVASPSATTRAGTSARHVNAQSLDVRGRTDTRAPFNCSSMVCLSSHAGWASPTESTR